MRSRMRLLANLAALLPAPLLCLGQDAPPPAQERAPAQPETAERPRDPRIDPETGRLRATYAPDREFDQKHIRIEIDIPDMQKAELTGKATIRAAALGTRRGVMHLDAKDLVVTGVRVGGAEAAFTQADGRLAVTLPAEVPAGVEVEVEVSYTLDFSKNKGESLTWSRGRPDRPSLTEQFPQIHSQGEPEYSRRWFPCHDFPHDRLTTEVIVTVEDGYDVSSNGRLVVKEQAGAGRTRWHWSMDKEHVTYLVTLVVGKFAIIEVGGPESARPGMTMPVYAPHGSEDNVRESYKNTAAMMAFFEKVFDEPYPWGERYAQLIVRDFAAGGMENTGASTMHLYTAGGGDHDDLIAHELAHQWFGNLITCRTWAHLWLNEGWASFSEALWQEHKAMLDGRNPDEAYQRAIVSNFRAQRRSGRATAPAVPPMVTTRWSDPEQMFRLRENVYPRGAIVLHMLRMELGDELFFKATVHFLDKHRNTSAETEDFRRAFEEATGRNLEKFFAQWVYRPGQPRLAVDLDWNADSGLLSIAVEQQQQIDGDNPAYEFTLPVRLTFGDGTTRFVSLPVAGRTAAAEFKLETRPTGVTIDPRLTIFARTEVRKPLPEPTAETPAPN